MSTTSATGQTTRPGNPSDWFVEWVSDWGGVALEGLDVLLDWLVFCLRTFLWLFTKLPRRETLLPSFYQVGVLSLPVVALTGTFIGMVMAVQSYHLYRQLGLETRLGAVINLSLVRELGPVLAATMLAGRVGCAMAAELGTMRVTEQIDALECMGSNPIYYLVVPRFLASIVMIPGLTVMADFMGVVGGYFYSVMIFNIDRHHYWYNSELFVNWFDVFSGVFKSIFFGAAISLVSCYRGFHCSPGAEGVGRAATAAFVFSFVLILVIDLGLGIFLNSVYYSIFPSGPRLI